MALSKEALVNNAAADTLESHNKRINSQYDMSVEFGTDAAATLMAVCYPVGFNKVTSKHGPWIKPAPATMVVTNTGGGGTWGLTVNGIAIADTILAWNITAALLKETILQSLGYTVSVTLANGVYTIVFDDDKDISVLPVISGQMTKVTGISATAVVTAGTATAGTHNIVGFVNPESVQLATATETVGVISTSCEIAYADIAALIGSGSITALEAALKNGLVAKGFNIQGLAGIH